MKNQNFNETIPNNNAKNLIVILYVQIYIIILVTSDKKEYQSHIDYIKHNDSTRICKVNINKGNRIIVCFMRLRMWKNRENN